jgi:hypothetical protein
MSAFLLRVAVGLVAAFGVGILVGLVGHTADQYFFGGER